MLTTLNKNLISIFKDNLDLLQEAYLMALKASLIEPFPNNSYLDNNGQNLNKILDADSKFIIKYIEYNFSHQGPGYYFDDIYKFSFLWRRDDYEELMTQVIKRFYRHPSSNSFLHIRHYLKKFFILEENGQDNDILKQRQDDLLQKIIQTSHQDINYILFLFEIITYFSYERRYKFIDLFLKDNKQFEDFKKLRLESGVCSWTDSAVPIYQKRIDYLESVRKLLKTVDFLQHKQYIESEIQRLQEVIEQEKKKDFTDFFRRSLS